MPQETLATVLRAYMARAGFTADRLAREADLPKATIVNWLKRTTRRTHDWRGLVRAADILRLTRSEVDDLLMQAGHSPLAALRRMHPTPKEQALLAVWLPEPAPPSDLDTAPARSASAAALQAAYAMLASIPVTGIPAPGPLPPGSRMPLHRNALFTGRDAEIHTVLEALLQDGTVNVNQVAAATGLGGIGKTQLAVELVHRYGQYFAGGVYWLSFGHGAEVAREVAACGGAQHLALDARFDQLTLDLQVQLVRAAWQSPLPRLLVFDNCETEELLRTWLPTSGGCRVLVTSRRRDWAPTLLRHAVALDVLGRAESLALLARYCSGMSDAELAPIAEYLGDLPLALHLAGSYLARYRSTVSPREFRAQLEQRSLLDHPALQGSPHSPTKHTDHVARTFALSYAHLTADTREDRRARTVLLSITLLAPGEPVPGRLLVAVLAAADPAASPTEHEDAISRVVQLGLVSREPDGAIRMHRLVLQFVRTQPAPADLQTLVQAVLLQLVDAESVTGDVSAVRDMRIHLRFVTDTALAQGNKAAAELSAALGYQYRQTAQFADARHYLEQALQLRAQAAVPEPLAVADSANLLGLLFQVYGHWEQARQRFEQALAIWERELGPTASRTIDEVNNLGYVLLLGGRFTMAEGLLRRALKARRQEYGLVHHQTARSVHNLGYLALQQGRYRNARRYLHLALALRTTLFAAPHPSTALTLMALGETYGAQGAFDAAVAYLKRSIALWHAVFGAEHMGIAECYTILGRLRQSQGNLNCAHDSYTRALAMDLRLIGRETRDVAQVLRGLGSVAREQHHLEEAAARLREALDLWNALGMAEHPEAALTYDELGLVDLECDNLSAAAAHFNQAIAIRRRCLPPTHPSIGTSLYYLGQLCQRQGAATAAASLYDEALAIFRAELLADHPLVRAVQQARQAQRDT